MAEIIDNSPPTAPKNVIEAASPSGSTNLTLERLQRNYLRFVVPMLEKETQEILADPESKAEWEALCAVRQAHMEKLQQEEEPEEDEDEDEEEE
jgi:hypothetical protein